MNEHSPGGARGLWRDAGRRLRRDRVALAALGVIVLVALFALLAPALSPWGYESLDWQHLALPPGASAAHWLGTDRLGRDLFVRTLHGVRLSLLISVLASLVSLVIGVLWGAVAGLAGGRTDGWMMRLVDVLYSLPYLFIVIILTTLWQRGSIAALLLALGAVGWLTTARIVRGQALALKHREFIEAARAVGVPAPAILLRHIVPNLLGPVVVYVTLTIPAVILAESFLSFLGLEVQPPMASLGTLIANGASDMELAPWLLVFPSLVMVVTLMCFNFIGDGLRDALDPKDR